MGGFASSAPSARSGEVVIAKVATFRGHALPPARLLSPAFLLSPFFLTVLSPAAVENRSPGVMLKPRVEVATAFSTPIALVSPAQVPGGPLDFEGAWGVVLGDLAVCKRVSRAKCKGRLGTTLKGNLWDRNLMNSQFTSANPGALGVPGDYQNPADASALLKNLAPAITAQLLLPEQVEVLLGCLSLGLRLSSPPCACLRKPSIAMLPSDRFIFTITLWQLMLQVKGTARQEVLSGNYPGERQGPSRPPTFPWSLSTKP
ncbi:hypothetical protein llap_4095 [Limosa lapponica baueri]|uniref:Uncharacterized protein n=1 Tax=Limosa lapponica baueri TaxID=1758121 RepID=A0A2I0UHV1_LIMLA|nr:hypothetical protein llap_4095 [Limosa lapponica baueri]